VPAEAPVAALVVEEKPAPEHAAPRGLLDEIKGFNKIKLRPKSDSDKAEETPKKGKGMSLMDSIMARGKMMKAESNGQAAKPDSKIAMPGQKPAAAAATPKKPSPAPKPARAPAPEPEPSINDMVLVRKAKMNASDSDSEGDWSADESD